MNDRFEGIEIAIPGAQMERLYLRWAMSMDLKEVKREMRLPEWKVRLAYKIFEKSGLPRFDRRFDLPWRKFKRSEVKRIGGLAPYELALLVEDLHHEIHKIAKDVYGKTNGNWERFVRRLNRIPPSWLRASRKQVVITKSIIGRFLPAGWKLRNVSVFLKWELAVVNISGKSQRALRLRKDEFLERYVRNDFSGKN